MGMCSISFPVVTLYALLIWLHNPITLYFPTVAPGSSPIVPEPKHHSLSKRHGAMLHNPSAPHNDPNNTPVQVGLTNFPKQLTQEMQRTLRRSRCGHVTYPNSVVGTPLITDLNSDGRQDIVYDVVWSPATASPPLMMAVAADLERMFEGAYGKGILDFSTFVPPKDQPWTQYMGKHADCTFRPPQST